MAEDERFSKKQYFKSWASYRIPMRPVDPITYEESEDLVSYYLGAYDERGNLVSFTKFVREVQSKIDSPLEEDLAPGSRLYFDVTQSGQPGEQISFSETENLVNYFRGVVAAADKYVVLVMINRTKFFEEQYAYWPDGALRSRQTWKEDGSQTETIFDETGRQVQRPERSEAAAQ